MADKKPTPTPEEVWALFYEVGGQIKELRASTKELRASTKELAADSKEAKEQAKEQSKAIDARIDKVTRNVDRLASNMGGLSKKWGDLGEAMTVGEAMPIFNAVEGIEVSSLYPNVTINSGDKELEIDGLAIGKDIVILMEAKATLKRDDIINFVNKKLKVFTKLEPIYEGKRIYGAMGFLSSHSGVQEYAQKQGLLLIRPHGTNKELVPLPEDFKLRNFHP